MRQSGSWMTIWDDRILEILRETGPMSVGELTDHNFVRVSQSQVSRRCKRLAEHGLVHAYANGVYDISDIGEQYLDGEVDASNLTDAADEHNGETIPT